MVSIMKGEEDDKRIVFNFAITPKEKKKKKVGMKIVQLRDVCLFGRNRFVGWESPFGCCKNPSPLHLDV